MGRSDRTVHNRRQLQDAARLLSAAGRASRDSPATRASRVPRAAAQSVGRVAIMTCLFNPERYVRIQENYRRFAEHMSGFDVDLWTIELAFDDDDFSLRGGPRTIQVRGTRVLHKLWQKERLLNLLLTRIPDEYDAIGWFDADVLFTNPDWVAAVRATLRRHVWCQPYINSWWRDARGGLSRFNYSAAWCRHFRRSICTDPRRAHPGFAWIARSSWLRQYGLYDRNPSGGGDALMLKAMTSRRLLLEPHLTSAWRQDFNRWARAARGGGGKCVGFAPGDLIHLYHGSRANRRYLERWEYLRAGAYDPRTDLVIDPENGLLRWSGFALRRKPRMVARISTYFAQRREDD